MLFGWKIWPFAISEIASKVGFKPSLSKIYKEATDNVFMDY